MVAVLMLNTNTIPWWPESLAVAIAWVWLAMIVAVALSPFALLGWIVNQIQRGVTLRALRQTREARMVGAVAFAIVLSLTIGMRTAYAFYIGPCAWADYYWAWWC